MESKDQHGAKQDCNAILDVLVAPGDSRRTRRVELMELRLNSCHQDLPGGALRLD